MLFPKPSCFGMRQDGVSPFADRGGLFGAFSDVGNVHATFVGHGTYGKLVSTAD